MNLGWAHVVTLASLTALTEVVGPLQQLSESMEKESVRLAVAQAGLTIKGSFYRTGPATQQLTGAAVHAKPRQSRPDIRNHHPQRTEHSVPMMKSPILIAGRAQLTFQPARTRGPGDTGLHGNDKGTPLAAPTAVTRLGASLTVIKSSSFTLTPASISLRSAAGSGQG